jgi:hypothetical protein
MRYATFLLATLVVGCFPPTGARADSVLFSARGDVDTYGTFPDVYSGLYTQAKTVVNTTDRTGVEVYLNHIGSASNLATAFAEVHPRAPGAVPSTPDLALEFPYVQIRTTAYATVNNALDTPLAVSAHAFGQWRDMLFFQPIAPAAAQIAGWGIAFHLAGSLEHTDIKNAPPVGVVFTGQLGSGPLKYIPDSINAGDPSHLLVVTDVIRSDPGNHFGSGGLAMDLTLDVYASADNGAVLNVPLPRGTYGRANFGDTASFPGLVAFDANGNILPDAGQWATVTTGSGVEIPILSAIPTAVPEPSTLITMGMGGIAIACLLWRRRPKH